MAREPSKDPIQFTARVVLTLLLLEIVTMPARGYITETLQALLYRVLPNNFKISWECTALDEVFLLAAALWWTVWPETKGCPLKSRLRITMGPIIVGTAMVELYNVLRIAILAYHPDPLLHTVLFRVGGYIVVLLTYWVLLRWTAARNARNCREDKA